MDLTNFTATDRAHSIREVAGILQVSDKHVRRLISSKALRAERLSARCIRIFDSEIARFRESARTAA